MKLEIIRYRQTGEAIDGHLIVDGVRLCDTAENIRGALPPGTYKIVRHLCKQYSRFVPAIVPIDAVRVDPRTCRQCPKLPEVYSNTTLPRVCPQLKMGNGIYGRPDGSIIMGTYIFPGCLKAPREPYESLSERVRKLTGRGSQITLTITEAY